jgi:hypothetical protein
VAVVLGEHTWFVELLGAGLDGRLKKRPHRRPALAATSVH